jgi:hypothetical protein
MLLNSDTVVHYLLQRGFLSFDSVVDGDLMVVEAPRRNRNFKLFQETQPGLFVKQVQQWDAQAIATVQREGSCYALAQGLPELSSLSRLLPGFRAYDPVRHVLVLDLLSGYETLAEHHQRLGQFPVEIAEALADALGTYHRETREKLGAIPQASIFPRMAPWALSMHLQQPDWFQSLSAANSQLLQVVKKYDQFSTALDRLRANWNYACLVHGDIKWDNCLVEKETVEKETVEKEMVQKEELQQEAVQKETVQAGNAGACKAVVKVVDWELADLGDPLWDVAAILQSYLSYWILSMPVWPGAAPEQMIAAAPWPLESLQPPMNAFWQRYCEVAEIPAAERKALLLRSVSYGAARMIQSAYESLSFAMQMNLSALYLLQVSMNILLNPEEGAVELFGIVEI